MKKINLKKVLDETGIEVNKAAEELFPGNAHPRRAINRVFREDALLDSDQISKLSAMTKIPIDKLFEDKFNHTDDGTDEILIYTENYRAKLNTKDYTVTVFENSSLVHETFKVNPNTEINSLLIQIKTRIENYKDNE